MNLAKSTKPHDLDEEEEPSLELKGLVHAWLRRSWLIVLGAVALGVAAAFYAHRLPDRFESRSVVQIQSDDAKQLTGTEAKENDLRDPMLMETVVQNFRNRSLLSAVVQKLNLTRDPAFLGPKAKIPVSEEDAMARLSGGLTVAARAKTLLVDISFVHPDPEVAKRIAAGIVDQFLRLSTEQQLRQAQAQTELLSQKANELREKMRRSEEAVQAFKNQAETVSLDAGRNLVEAKLTDMNNSLAAARNERLKLEGDLRMVQQVPDRDPKQLVNIASVATDPEVAAAETKVRTMESEIQAMSDRFRAKHPRMVEAQNRLESARGVLTEAVKGAPDRMAARYAGAQSGEQTLEKAAAAQERELLKLDEKVMPYRALQQELEADRALFDGVQKRLKQSAAVMDIRPVNFQVVEAAVPAYRLADRRPILITAGILTGAFLAAGLIAAIYFLDASIKTVDEAERLLGLPVLSAVPKLNKVKTPAELLTLLDKPDSAVAESFRSLRTALSLLGPAAERKVLLFTSAVPSEGKTLTTANTAIAFAQQGLRTVVLDADLRRPKLTGMFVDPAAKHPGVAEFLVQQPLAVRETEIPNLFLLPAGGTCPNPAELLANGRFAELVATLKDQYDRVVIDTAPVNVVSDTLSIVHSAQTIALVVRNGATSRKLVRRALELLRRAHVRPDGLVLNFMPLWNGVGHHYYYSSTAKYGGEGTYGTSYPGAQPAAPASTAT